MRPIPIVTQRVRNATKLLRNSAHPPYEPVFLSPRAPSAPRAQESSRAVTRATQPA